MYKFNDYYEQRLANEGIKDWPGQAWNWLRTGGGLFKGKTPDQPAQQKDVGDGVSTPSGPESQARAGEFKNMMGQLRQALGVQNLDADLSQDTTVRQRAYSDPSYLENAFRLMGVAANHASQIGFQQAIDLLARKRQELSLVGQQLQQQTTQAKTTADFRKRANEPDQRPGTFPDASGDASLGKSARELYIVKATRMGMDDQEIIQNLVSNYGVKSPAAAKTMIARIRQVNSNAR